MGDDDRDRSSSAGALAARWTWTVLLILVVGSGLAVLTTLLGWWEAAAMCLLGVVAGVSVSYALVRSGGHAAVAYYAALAFGLLVLPGLAVFLGIVAGRDSTAFAQWNAVLTPFVTFALTTVAVWMTLAFIWRPRVAEQHGAVGQPDELDEWEVLQAEAEAERKRQLAAEADLAGKAG